jgi:heme oxygenase
LFTLQVLARVVVKALELPDDGTGTAFYRFPEIPSAKVFKDEYRRLLDETKVDPSTCDLIVAEVSVHVRVLI